MKILSLDIETYPNRLYSYGVRNQFHGPESIDEPSRMLSLAYQWVDPFKLTASPMKFIANWQRGGQSRFVEKTRALIMESDAVMGWHSKGFDIPVIRGECRQERLVAIPRDHPNHVDLFAQMKNEKHVMKRLEYQSMRTLGVGKLKHEGMIELAVAAHYKKDKDARKRLEAYNRQDVERVTDLFFEWFPLGYITLPNVNLYSGQTGDKRCRNCATPDLRKEGYVILETGKYQRYQCRNCNSWSRSTTRVDGVRMR